MSRDSISLVLTKQERAALSIALKTLLELWGSSEDGSQARIHAKLKSIAAKLDALHGEPIDLTRAVSRVRRPSLN
jgi:hypothetical protein